METNVRVSVTSGLAAFVEASGGSFARVLAEAGVEARELADPERWMPVRRAAALLNAAARELRDDAFGLHYGLRREASAVGVLRYAIRHAPTVGAALRNADRFSGLQMQRGRMHFLPAGGLPLIRFEITPADYELLRWYSESVAVLGLRLVRSLCGEDWAPQRVRFGHSAPRDPREYERSFGCPVEFDQGVHFEVTLAPADLAREVVGADPTLLRLVESHLRLQLGGDPHDGWVAEVRHAVADALSNGEASIRAVSKRLGLSPRTLQRRLEAHRTSFQSIVSAVRRELADQYLGTADLSLAEVAFLLGYSDLSSFHRAFRRWSGKTPTEKRRSLISSAVS
ncbi:MAG TPA: AraC family transcriptional regulator [Myxococcota bacterium]|nr:AraC family transcriptional regulator [Myxococcota bacterium]